MTEPDRNQDRYFLPDGSIVNPSCIEDRYHRPFSNLSKSDRDWIERTSHPHQDHRSPTERDKDRIIYGSYLHRLAGVTQIVTPPVDRSNFHSRMTHSFKVANLAREIAEDLCRRARLGDSALLANIVALGGLDIGACEAAGLAHDLGHPPFGHVAEKIIDSWLRSTSPEGTIRCANGFEGNAQSLHIVSDLELRVGPIDNTIDDSEGTQANAYGQSRGLGLSAVTLAAIQKYPWVRQLGTPRFEGKFNAYHFDSDILDKSRRWFTQLSDAETGNLQYVQTLEASVMDLADDITYAVHDLQDFVLAGILPIRSIKKDAQAFHDLISAKIYQSEDRHENLRVTFSNEEISSLSPGAAGFYEHWTGLETYYEGIAGIEDYRNALVYSINELEKMEEVDDGDDLKKIALVRRVVSDIIGSFMQGIEGIVLNPNWEFAPRLQMKADKWHDMQVLKHVTKAYVIATPLIGVHQAAQISSLEALLEKLEHWCFYGAGSKEIRYLPKRLQSLYELNRLLDSTTSTRTPDKDFEEDYRYRAIIDFCCSLTDMEAHHLAQVLQGIELPRITL
ncbi:dGTP triphosphohydrolase [Paenarthrobacter nicotinovorans]|uniref:dGTP triphosphohydrolase n=1 Tax=Paenarthrobacter nicotinovorans TaxID=29320 RepID=UPI003D6716C7